MKNLAVSILVILFGYNFAFTQITETKLVPSGAQRGDRTGHSVAIWDNYLVIGAPNSGDFTGCAYVYEKTDGVWIEKTRLTASDSYTSQYFGWQVAIYDDVILIGAYGDDDNGTNAGAAYIFRRDPQTGTWDQQVKLLPADGDAYDKFGYSVSLWGNYALIGAPLYNGDIGSVYLFKRTGNTWIQEAKLIAENGVGEALFGCAVSVQENYAVIGAHYDEEKGHDAGAAYIFHFDGLQWVQQAKIFSSDINKADSFGMSVSISGETVVVGASPKANAYIFRRKENTWTEEAILTKDYYTQFGCSVSIEGGFVVIGAYYDDTFGSASGCGYIYRYENNIWTEEAKLLASDGNEGDWMGWSVSLKDDQVLVGASRQYAGGINSGAVYLYENFVTGMIDSRSSKVKDCFLEQNYPNPFYRNTFIGYHLPVSGYVTLKVFDILGREVSTLVNEHKPAGSYEVEFRPETGSRELPTGKYFYRLKTVDHTSVKEMLLLK